MTKARDVRYGRRGGHWIDGDGTTTPPAPMCTECGRAVYVAGTRPDIHRGCETAEPADDPQGSLL